MTQFDDLQSSKLEEMRRTGTVVAVWLVSGKRLIGRIRGFDRFTFVLDHGGSEHLVFKHAVATIGPAKEPQRD